eukprot:scaffold5033_cov18-Tisochrysis_lutea.AAC.5
MSQSRGWGAGGGGRLRQQRGGPTADRAAVRQGQDSVIIHNALRHDLQLSGLQPDVCREIQCN